MNAGILYALATYLLWGVFPIYWKQLQHVSAEQVIAHRILWSFIMLFSLILFTNRQDDFRAKLNSKTLRTHGISALLIGANWLTYVWAVNNGYIVESSLGYFINPLFSVFLGMIFFGEKLRPFQWVSLGLATIGVLYLTFTYGRPPWIALMLALSFGFYGLFTKKSALGSLYGLTLDTGIIFIPALIYLLYLASNRTGAFLQGDFKTTLYLIGAGAVTSIPLLLFAKAAHRIPLTTIGLMQYISPTIQFLIGILLYKEVFTPPQAIGFSIIWLALFLFWGEEWWSRRKKKRKIANPE